MLLQTALVALGATLVAAVPPLEVKGQYFVNPKTGNRFQIVGVAYQPGGSAGYNKESGIDPLSDEEVCLRDAAILQVLGVNTIRVYNVNPDLNHDKCASIFNAAGIYMILDVNSPLVGEALTSYNPWESYYDTYLNRTFAVVEAFKNYPNTLAFFAGNEVIDRPETTATVPPYMRAVTRDIKNYVKRHCDRKIPVGYSAADVRSSLFDTFRYFTCSLEDEDDDISQADIFALNSYSWCGKSTFEEATYDDLVAGFKDSPVPVFFSEYGCNEVLPRIFQEVTTIYSDKMDTVFSGGVVYEYTQEANNYGLVDLSSSDKSAKLLNDYVVLRSQYAKLDWEAIQSKKPPSSDAPKAPTCDSKLITTKGFNSNFTLPVEPPNVEDIIKKGVKPTPKGKIVDIDNWEVKLKVYAPDGTEIKGLKVKKLKDDEINRAGVNDITISANSTTSAGTSSDDEDAEEDAAVRPAAALFTAVAMGAMAVLTTLF